MSESKKRTRGMTVLVRGAQALLGLIAGIAIAEGVFYYRDGGAFPHANFYVRDEKLGVRLEPGATERIALLTNPASEIRINSRGYRGGEWPAPGEDEILVVGDSQVFGLGVEESETFAARLAEITGRTVINGGVPTYGPLEYNEVVREIGAERKPKTVVYVVNFVNDLFENERPNVDRHVEWDGWAVRAETAPASYVDFPMRRLLFQKSHLVYALRRYVYQQGEQLEGIGFASEGTWADLVHLGSEASSEHTSTAAIAREREAEHRTQLAQARRALGEAETRVDEVASRAWYERGSYDDEQELRLDAVRGRPGDIVSVGGEEESRAVQLTAQLIRQGVQLRNRLLDDLVREGSGDAVQAIARRDAAGAQLAAIETEAVPPANVTSVLEPRLVEVKAICDEIGAELVVIALPIDVQVSPEEWAKYGVTDPVDMTETRVLLGDLVHTANAMRVRALDATPALAAAEPGAFLHHDIHMTAKGHQAFAGAIAEALEAPLPVRAPIAGALPEGRSRVPSPEEFLHTPEATVIGSSRAGCETVIVREWFRAICKRSGRNRPTGVEVTAGGRGEAMTIATEHASTLVVPLLEGDEVRADFSWQDRVQTLVLHAGGEMRFEDARRPGRPLVESADAARLCACHAEVNNERACHEEYGYIDEATCRPTCTYLYGEVRPACFEAYRDDCARLLECARGEPAAQPACAEGEAQALATAECRAICDETHPCATGTCTPWAGSAVCL